MFDNNRRARQLIVAVAALAVGAFASGVVSAQSPSAPAAAVESEPPGAPSDSPAPSATLAAPSMSPAPAVPVALLLPNTTEPRWETTDKTAFEDKLGEVCPSAVLDARNAGGDPAAQIQQAQAALAAGAKVLVLDAVDPATGAAITTMAHAANAKVIGYDTQITGAAPDYHIGYDPAAVGSLVADAVLTSDSEAAAAASPEPTARPGGVRVVLIEGPAADPSSAAWVAKVLEGLAAEATVVHREVASALTADEGQRIIGAAIAALGPDGFDSVITSDDTVAAGVIAGLAAAGLDPAAKQVTGGEATIPGVQQVLVNRQLLTTYAPATAQAELAAVVACGLATGTGLPSGLTAVPVSNGTADIRSLLLTGVAVTVDGSIAGTRSVSATIVADKAFGPDTVTLICTADYLTACDDADISLPSASPSPAVPSQAPSAPASPAPSMAPAASSAAP